MWCSPPHSRKGGEAEIKPLIPLLLAVLKQRKKKEVHRPMQHVSAMSHHVDRDLLQLICRNQVGKSTDASIRSSDNGNLAVPIACRGLPS